MTDRRYRLVTSFDDPTISAAIWDELLSQGATDEIFLTYEYQRTWWEVFQPGELRIVTGFDDRELRSILPLYSDSGMLYPVGAGADYFDVMGNFRDEADLADMLALARDGIQEFHGAQLFHLPVESPTASFVPLAANKLGWKCFEEHRWSCPALDLSHGPDLARNAASKKSLVRHEAFFRRNGDLTFEDHTSPAEIEGSLEELFDQHIERWSGSGSPSLFVDGRQRSLYKELVRGMAGKNWIRFTRVLWDGRPIALHFGFEYKNKFLWYKPTFDIALARHSPGEVLLRHLLLSAGERGCRLFDFGLGDEAFKARFSNSKREVVTIGLYP